MKKRMLPDIALKVVLSGLFNSAWGSGHRRPIVRFFIYGDRVKIGVGEGNIKGWEIDALRYSPIRHEWFRIKDLRETFISGVKYVPGRKLPRMPRELIPLRSDNIHLFISDEESMIFPAYRCFDINLGEGRVLSIISPETLVRDVSEVVHPSFPKERYKGRVNNVEVKIEDLSPLLDGEYGIGILRKAGLLKTKSLIEAMPLLGAEDLKIILEHIL